MARKESFIGRDTSPIQDPNLISAKVKRKVNKREASLNVLTRDEKMLCAIRKALAAKSGMAEQLGARFYIADNQVYVTRREGGIQSRDGEASTYSAAGRFKLGICREHDAAFRVVQFDITYKDTTDDRGIADVVFVDPTTIDILPKSTSIIPSQ